MECWRRSAYTHSLVPHGEAEENAAHNYLWPEAAESAARHRGQLLVTVLPREESVREAAILQVKLVCAACRQRGTLGVYANGTVYQPEFYLNAAQPMEDGELPLLDLVWMGLYRREEGLCGYTDGLAAFGKEEIEVLGHPLPRVTCTASCWIWPAMYWRRMSPSTTGRPSALPRGSICPSPAAPVSGTTA